MMYTRDAMLSKFRAARNSVAVFLTLLTFVGTPVISRGETLPSQLSSLPANLQKIYDGGEPESLDDLKAMEVHQQRLVERLVACTVGLRIGSAHGSGVIIRKNGYVLTAAHVIGKPGRKATIILPNGRQVEGKTLGIYRTLDAGLVKIDGDGPWPFAEMAGPNDLAEGQWCVATGHPGGYQDGRTPVVRIGRVLLTGKFAITTDCTLVGGDSGGPLFDMEGRVIGINSRIGRFLSANLHVPINAFYSEWDRLKQGESWGALPGTGPYIGVQGDAESAMAKVLAVTADAPAAQAGIRSGDIIIELGGKEVTDFESLQLRVNDCRPGEKVTVVVQRNDQKIELAMTIGKRK